MVKWAQGSNSEVRGKKGKREEWPQTHAQCFEGKMTPTGSGQGEPKETDWVWVWQQHAGAVIDAGLSGLEHCSSHWGCGSWPRSWDPTGAVQFHDRFQSKKGASARASLKSSNSSLTLLDPERLAFRCSHHCPSQHLSHCIAVAYLLSETQTEGNNTYVLFIVISQSCTY